MIPMIHPENPEILSKVRAGKLWSFLLIIVALLLMAISVRFLTLQFMRAHLNDPGWFQTGSYAKFDRQARDILDGRQSLFWIEDPTRTDLAQYPPAFPAL